MFSSLTIVDFSVFALSLLLCVIIGAIYLIPVHRRWSLLLSLFLLKERKQNNNGDLQSTGVIIINNNNNVAIKSAAADDYFLGGRNLSLIPVVFSLFATSFSAIALLGTPAEIYTYGTAPILSTMSFIPASIFVAVVFIPIYYTNGFKSIFEYIEKRFNSVLLRKITTSLSALSAISYCAVCAYAPCAAFEQASGIPEWILLVATGLITVFYTTTGGIRAVVIVDTIQAVIMFFGIIAVLIVGSQEVGGMARAWTVAEHYGRTAIYDWRIDPSVTHSFWSIFFGAGFFFLASTNNQSTLQRSCSLNSLPKAMLSLVFVGPLAAMLTIILWLTTLVAFSYFAGVIGCDPFVSGAIKSPNQIMSYFVGVVMAYPGFRGLYYACLFSGSLSTLSTSFNSVSSNIWEDWLKDFLEPKLSSRQASNFIKFLAALIGIVTCALALSCKYIGGTAMRMVTMVQAAFSGAILAVFLAAAFLPFITSFSLIIGMMVAVPCVLSFIVFQIIYQVFRYPWLPMVGLNCTSFTNNSTYFQHIGNGTFTAFADPTVNLHHNGNHLHPHLLRSVFSLSYNYFPLLSIIICLVVASLTSVVTIMLSQAPCMRNFKWLQPPCGVNPNLLTVDCWRQIIINKRKNKSTDDVIKKGVHPRTNILSHDN